MRDFVQAFEPEQRIRLQKRDAERPLFEEACGQPARLGERRQKQRVEPDDETCAEARSFK